MSSRVVVVRDIQRARKRTKWEFYSPPLLCETESPGRDFCRWPHWWTVRWAGSWLPLTLGRPCKVKKSIGILCLQVLLYIRAKPAMV